MYVFSNCAPPGTRWAGGLGGLVVAAERCVSSTATGAILYIYGAALSACFLGRWLSLGPGLN